MNCGRSIAPNAITSKRLLENPSKAASVGGLFHCFIPGTKSGGMSG
jgi:hypothetical protein